jgi:hypothetical protein
MNATARIARLFVESVLVASDVQCPATQNAVDAIAAANYQSRGQMFDWFARIAPDEWVESMLVAWVPPRVPDRSLRLASGRTRDQWLDIVRDLNNDKSA